jgi:hypothetical protein
MVQAQVAVLAPVEVHCAVGAHPPLFAAHALSPVQVVPVPVYPALQVHEF